VNAINDGIGEIWASPSRRQLFNDASGKVIRIGRIRSARLIYDGGIGPWRLAVC
jgi:hypothetical protein